MGISTLSPRQVKHFELIRTLLAEIKDLNEAVAETWRVELNLARSRGQFDEDASRQAIQDLIAAKRGLEGRVPEGRYAVEIDGTLKFYSITVSAKGFVRGFVWASDEQHPLPFPVLRSVLTRITELGIRQSSTLFGQKIGVCGRCGRTLTDEASRAAGIGPVCASKL